MSYLVLARKWRPQNFADLVGQEHVSQTLGNAIRTGRVHHAFLFTGARGVGKTSAARIFAKALNCEKGLSPDPCNECPSCLEITSGQGLDVFEIDGASNTGVDDIRELRENIRYLPSRSRYKIFIIDEVHMLSINAFNALLKTLEEPPDHAKFIFATTEPHKIPVTILSRTQRFDFRKIALPKVVARLREIVDAESIRMSDRALALVARKGGGSMRDSLSTLDQVIAFCGEDVPDEEVQGLLGMVDRRLLLNTAEGILQRDSHRVLDAVRRVDNLGHPLRQFCQELVELFRGLILIGVLENPGELLDATEDELKQLRALAEAAPLEDHQRALDLLVKAEQDLAGSSFPRLVLEMVLVRLAHLPAARDVGTLVRKIEDLERRLAGGLPAAPPASSRPAPPMREERAPAPARAPEAPAAARAPEAPARASEAPAMAPEAPAPARAQAPPGPAGEKGWQGFVEFVKSRRRPMIASLLDQASLLSLDLPEMKVGLPAGSFAIGQLEDSENLDSLTALAEEYFGREVRIKVSPVNRERGAVPPSLQEERKAKETDHKERVKEDALAHPMVKAAVDIFDGKVREVKPLD